MKRFTLIGAAAVLVLAACGSDGDNSGGAAAVTTVASDSADTTTPGDSDTAATDGATTDSPDTTSAADDAITDDASADGVRNVPDEYPTIQAAVDAAVPGDLVLIAPGTYHEAVDVGTDELTIRGLDRDTVILDGELELDNGIRVLGAQNVAVENLTAMNYTNNGVFWVGSTGYRASYITTYRTGDYGIYAFDSTNGLIEQSHTVGSRDAGVYIGQCYPCNAVIDGVLATHNGLGYSGTNSGGNLLIINSEFTLNRVGLVPNSGSYELCYPQRETTIVGNLVYDNNNGETPAIDVALLAQGNGILVAGGIRNTIERNRVDNHDRTGIGLVPFVEAAPNDDMPTKDEWADTCDVQKQEIPVIPEGALLWDSFENRVVGNVISDSREADIAVASAGGDISTFGNCFSDNEVATSAPTDLQTLAPCDGVGSGDWTAGDLEVFRWINEQATQPPDVPWQTAVLPELGAHDNMADAARAPAAPAVDMPPAVDLASITVPELP